MLRRRFAVASGQLVCFHETGSFYVADHYRGTVVYGFQHGGASRHCYLHFRDWFTVLMHREFNARSEWRRLCSRSCRCNANRTILTTCRLPAHPCVPEYRPAGIKSTHASSGDWYLIYCIVAIPEEGRVWNNVWSCPILKYCLDKKPAGCWLLYSSEKLDPLVPKVRWYARPYRIGIWNPSLCLYLCSTNIIIFKQIKMKIRLHEVIPPKKSADRF
jgi:hypothetical protein